MRHGKGGNAKVYSGSLARQMRKWGLVVIATNYTHAAGVALGSPGEAPEEGASAANILRGRLCLEILRSRRHLDAESGQGLVYEAWGAGLRSVFGKEAGPG